jgi:segregation and condensation protein A
MSNHSGVKAVGEFENVIPLASARRTEDATLVVDVEGFEGPLDLLLALAKTQKVDLSCISILRLVEQYLAFIDGARSLRLEIAADYLVMAAWLAYLKSRLLLPEPPADDETPSGEELARLLAVRLQRLEAMRDAAALLMERNRLGRDVFPRGTPEGVSIERRSAWHADLYDLLKAYAEQRMRRVTSHVVVRRRSVVALTEAREALERMLGFALDWCSLETLLAPFFDGHVEPTSMIASSFAASLELAREGRIELRQERMFGPLFARLPPASAAEG